MAKTFQGAVSLESPATLASTLRALLMLRLAAGITILLGAATALTGTSWDIQWHIFVGRDRTLIPPHEMMLTGIALAGVAALLAVVTETVWVKRNPELAKYSLNFADLFHGSLGAYIAGFAALDGAIAFPLDAYWHALYGIDVAILAPFHVMIITSMAITALGAAYILLSASQLALTIHKITLARLSSIGAIVAFATMMGTFSLLLEELLGRKWAIQSAAVTIGLFPLFSCLLFLCTFNAARYALPRSHGWIASSVAAVYILFGLLFSTFVPSATNYLVTLEHLQYREQLGQFSYLSIVAVRFWYLTPMLAALLFDIIYTRATKYHWSHKSLTWTLSLIGIIAGLPVAALALDLTPRMIQQTGVIGFPITLSLAILGSWIGIWLGRTMGEAPQRLERVQ